MPYIVRQCLEEIERRGMEEVGIYRVSGVATDIQALKTAFDTSEYSPHLYTVPALHRFYVIRLLNPNLFWYICCVATCKHVKVSVKI